MIMTRMRIIINTIWVVLLLLVQGCTSVGRLPEVGAPLAEPKRKPVLGLALGGGASRGFAHIGVLQVLEEAGIRPDLVVGTSAGSLVAALYASGKSTKELQQIALSMDELSIADWSLPFVGKGMLRGEALGRYVSTQVRGRNIEEMVIPLGVVATNFQTGEGVLFRRGDTGIAVRASSAIPGVFSPVRIGTVEYVDGGLVSPVPVLQAKEMGAQIVLAIDISSSPEQGKTGGALEMILQTTSIMGRAINGHVLKSADVVVRPALAGHKSTDFTNRQQLMEAGRQAMLAALPRLKALLESQ